MSRGGAKRSITDAQVEDVIIRDAAWRDALEYARDGESRRPQSHRDQEDRTH
jgi:hypothetical protein